MDMMSTEIGHLAMALSKFQGEVAPIAKTIPVEVEMKTGRKYTYFYADLGDIWDAIQQPLCKNELAVTQSFVIQNNVTLLQTMILHSSGQWMKSQIPLAEHEKVQMLGGEITYLRRYALSSILGIITEQDDDGKMANEDERKINTPKAVPTLPKYASEIKDSPPITITNAQFAKIWSQLANNKSLADKVRNHFRVKDLKAIPYSKYTEACVYINNELQGATA